EAGFPIPHRPTQPELVERLAELRVKAGAGRRVRADVTAEFTNVYRATIVVGPFLCLLQRAAERERAARILVRRQRVVTLEPVELPAAQVRRRVSHEGRRRR